MFGSIRVLYVATTQLDDFPLNGIQWGDLGEGKRFRHAGLAAEQVMKIVPNALYAGSDPEAQEDGVDRDTLERRAFWKSDGKPDGQRETHRKFDRCI